MKHLLILDRYMYITQQYTFIDISLTKFVTHIYDLFGNSLPVVGVILVICMTYSESCFTTLCNNSCKSFEKLCK